MQKLLATVSVGTLSQHGKGHVDIHRGTGNIVSRLTAQKLRQKLRPTVLQAVCVTFRLIVQSLLLVPPFAVEFRVALNRVCAQLRIFRSCHGIPAAQQLGRLDGEADRLSVRWL
jgi:hypothetical protein